MKAFASAGIKVARLVTDVGAIVSRRLEQTKAS
jgi:hypothetical protein